MSLRLEARLYNLEDGTKRYLLPSKSGTYFKVETYHPLRKPLNNHEHFTPGDVLSRIAHLPPRLLEVTK